MPVSEAALVGDNSVSRRALVPLSALVAGQEADFFALLAAKEELRTREGKPYFRVCFRDARREVNFPIWIDSHWGPACRNDWSVGTFYKLRAVYRESNFGPELEIRAIRPVNEKDREDGFDPDMLLPRSREEPQILWERLHELMVREIPSEPLRNFVAEVLRRYRREWLRLPASCRYHHPHLGGLLEHTLHVAENTALLARAYRQRYPEKEVPFEPQLAVAGAILHDAGKLLELVQSPQAADFSASGMLLGHGVLGRDILHQVAATHRIDPEWFLRLEHIVISHHGEPEGGTPRPPMTLEALLVQLLNQLDAKWNMAWKILSEEKQGAWTSDRNILKQRLYRGPSTSD